jgi:hypothetical protein
VIARLLGLLDRDAGRLVVAGVALAALGIVTTLRTLADAAGQWSDALPLGDRAVLGLYDAHPAHAVPFLVGAALLAVGLRLRGGEPGAGAGLAAGVAWAYLALGACAALAALYTAASGSFGDGVAAVELTGRERTFGLAEQFIGNAAIAVAALAAARALLRPAEPEPARSLEDDEDEEAVLWPAEGGRLPGIAEAPTADPVLDGADNGWPSAPAEVPALAATGLEPAAAPAREPEPDPEPEPATPAERYRRLYDRQLRFSPRAAEARTLLARLRDDPEDPETHRALERLAAPERTVE